MLLAVIAEGKLARAGWSAVNYTRRKQQGRWWRARSISTIKSTSSDARTEGRVRNRESGLNFSRCLRFMRENESTVTVGTV